MNIADTDMRSDPERLSQQELEARLEVLTSQLKQEMVVRAQLEAALQETTEALELRIVERTAALNASEAMFRYVLARANDGYVILDGQDHIVYANAQARLYLGLSEKIKESEPSPFKDLVAKQYNLEPYLSWEHWPQRSFVDDTPAPFYLVRPETVASNAFWLEVKVLDVPAGIGETSGRIVHLRDITERTALQEQLNRFHSVISHKLRAPLVPVYSGLQYLVQFSGKLTREDILEFIQDAFEGVSRLYSEVEDILQYLDTARFMRAEERFSVSKLEGLVTKVRKGLELQSVAVVIDEAVDDVNVLLTQRGFELMLHELLDNAKKFHPQHTPRVEIRVFCPEAPGPDPHQLCIQVRDDGLTLSPEQLSRMWTPYYQGEKFSTGQVPGMGLGLSLVATQVWNIGGTCCAYNQEDGPGIVVELTLPC
ncbi:MAG: hypothetical protein JXA33_10615 [Anaerolineae bacterium]|nr:hypothetical protein [Anaerolineae bacterium]